MGTIFLGEEIVCSHLPCSIFFQGVIKYSAFTAIKGMKEGRNNARGPKNLVRAPRPSRAPSPPGFPVPPFLCSTLASPPDIDSGHYVSKQAIYLYYCISISLSVQSLTCISAEAFPSSLCGSTPAGSASTAWHTSSFPLLVIPTSRCPPTLLQLHFRFPLRHTFSTPYPAVYPVSSHDPFPSIVSFHILFPRN